MIKRFLLILIFTGFSSILMAEDGCYLTSGPFEKRVYYILQNSNSNQFYSGDFNYLPDCPKAAPHPIYIMFLTSGLSSVQCFAQLRQGASTDSTNPGDYVYNGNLVTFELQNCSLHNYLSLFLVTSATLGVFFIKKLYVVNS